ncbi:hypothetical protein B566_EDAN009210 [Ephemera danica]|nr:hypothetical protein B566_EDAN009210 [Ephemera danica]
MAASRCSSVLVNFTRRLSTSTNSSFDLTGIYPPIPTPFNQDESIAYDKLKSNFEVWEQLPFKGYLVQGSNGEFKMLRDSERVKLIAKARECIGKNKLLLAGSSCESTLATVEMSNEMSKAGADAVLIINPSYYRGSMTDGALHSYYTRVADNCKIPVVLYNMPANTGIDMSAALVTDLAKHPNIIGFKESGPDVGKMAQIVQQTKGLGFQVLAGSASLLLPALTVGCVGGINGFANVFGAELCKMVVYFREGRLEDAAELQRRIILPNAMITRNLGVPATKAVMDLVDGLYGGPCREPLLPLTPEQRKSVVETFINAGFMK